LNEDKAILRRQLRLLLSEVTPEQRDRASQRVGGLLCADPAWVRAACVMGFVSLATEICTEAVLRSALADGKRLLLPRVDWPGRRIIAGEVRSLAGDLSPGRFGIREPRPGPPANVEDIDLILVPGLAFDGAGRRLGRGGGYYDRFLAELAPRTVRCGLAFECQRFTSPLPTDPHDIAVDLLVTEAGVHRFTPRAGPREGNARLDATPARDSPDTV
jgi:5-formyltetrahydrofolate cyclo-ligase